MISVIPVIVVVVLSQFDVVQDDTEDSGSHILQHLPRATHDPARSMITMHDQQHAINQLSDQDAIGEGSYRMRVKHNMSKLAFEYLHQAFHRLRNIQYLRVGMDLA